MKTIILTADNMTPFTSMGSMDIFRKTNSLLSQTGQANLPSPFFDIRIVGIEGKQIRLPGGLQVECHEEMETVEQCDLVLIPAIEDDVEENVSQNRKAVPWLNKMYQRGAELASTCTGAFLLAEAGLLDGKRATTHWAFEELFQKRYPKVQLLTHQIIVDEGRICTSGGATAFLNLLIYLIEKFCGRDVAHMASKFFLIDINKGSQKAYSIFSSQKDHGDAAILKAQNFIENNVERRISVEEIARTVAISKRNLIRRFKKATGNTPIEYIQRVKVEEVKKSLEYGPQPVEHLVQKIGYEDTDSFRKIFRRFTGISPTEYRKKYQHVEAYSSGR